MNAKTIVELLTLSTNLYFIAKDKDLFEKLQEIAKDGKGKWDEVMGEGELGDQEFMDRLLQKAKQAKEELETKMEEIAIKAYKKMQLVHASELEALNSEVEILKKQLGLAEARIHHLEERYQNKQ